MSSWKLPNLRATWQNVTDKADEEENVNKVTLPVGIVIGVIGILVASWLIWCVLGGCDSVNSSQQTSMAVKRSETSYSLSSTPKPPKSQTSVVESSRTRPPRPAPKPPTSQTSMVVESSTTKTTAPLKVSTPRLVESADQFLLDNIKRVNEPVALLKVNEQVASLPKEDRLLKAAGNVANALKKLTENLQVPQKGGGNNLTGMPLIVIIIMMLVVRAKLTDRS